MKGKVCDHWHRPKLFTDAQEKFLVNHVLEVDRQAVPMDMHRVKLVAFQIIYGSQNEGERKVVSDTWYRRFIIRAPKQYPQPIVATERGTKFLSLKSISSEVVNWWFTTVKARAVELGVATDSKDDEIEDEMIWKFRGRVVITDETAISDTRTRTGQEANSNDNHSKNSAFSIFAKSGTCELTHENVIKTLISLKQKQNNIKEESSQRRV